MKQTKRIVALTLASGLAFSAYAEGPIEKVSPTVLKSTCIEAVQRHVASLNSSTSKVQITIVDVGTMPITSNDFACLVKGDQFTETLGRMLRNTTVYSVTGSLAKRGNVVTQLAFK